MTARIGIKKPRTQTRVQELAGDLQEVQKKLIKAVAVEVKSQYDYMVVHSREAKEKVDLLFTEQLVVERCRIYPVGEERLFKLVFITTMDDEKERTFKIYSRQFDDNLVSIQDALVPLFGANDLILVDGEDYDDDLLSNHIFDYTKLLLHSFLASFHAQLVAAGVGVVPFEEIKRVLAQ